MISGRDKKDSKKNGYSAASVLPIVAPKIYESSQSTSRQSAPYDKYSFYLMVAIVLLNFGAVGYCFFVKPAQHLDFVRAQLKYPDGFVDNATPKVVDSMTDLESDGDIDDSTEDEVEDEDQNNIDRDGQEIDDHNMEHEVDVEEEVTEYDL